LLRKQFSSICICRTFGCRLPLLLRKPGRQRGDSMDAETTIEDNNQTSASEGMTYAHRSFASCGSPKSLVLQVGSCRLRTLKKGLNVIGVLRLAFLETLPMLLRAMRYLSAVLWIDINYFTHS
jgi:hypothetical protein